ANCLVVDGRDDRYRGAAAAGATGSADSVHVVVGMMRHVEIQNVADLGNIETASGDVRRDQQLGLAATEAVQCRHPPCPSHIAVQRDRVEFVPQQRAMQVGDLALAVAKDNRVLEAGSGTDKSA